MPTFNDTRIRKVNAQPTNANGQYVLYWCQMFRRLTHNHALDYAIHTARNLKKPLVVYEGLKLNYPWASPRFHHFMLEGMRDNAIAAKSMGLTYWPFVETPGDNGHGLVKSLADKASIVITDDYPAFIVPAHNRALAKSTQTAVHAVDGNSVVPLSLLGKVTSAAAHLRPRMHKLFAESWTHRAIAEPDVTGLAKGAIDAPFKLWSPPKDLTAFMNELPLDRAVPIVPGQAGGTVAGKAVLANFLKNKLSRYSTERSQPDSPTRNSSSGLSVYLHYGQLSVDEVIDGTLNANGKWTSEMLNLKTRNKDDFFCRDDNVNGFLDEAITWRDIGFHWHHCRNLEVANAKGKNQSWAVAGEAPRFNFETMDFSPRTGGTLDRVLPEWAKASLNKHASDKREFHYTLEQWEHGDTHDDLWNAAQRELVATGKMHNYMRMLWGKKVLEWSANPEEAYVVLEHLNNKYATDGRDPNSYTGILWCFGLFDRPWPPERQVFGNIRYMSSANTAKKFKLAGYYDYIHTLGGKTTVARSSGRTKSLF